MIVNSTAVLNKFTKTICKNVCGLCKTPIPSMCISQLITDVDRFFEIMKHVYVYGKLDTWSGRQDAWSQKDYSDMKTFKGFCRLFCGFSIDCPAKGPVCDNLDARIACYEVFHDQDSEKTRLSQKDYSEIYRKFSGIEIRDIGIDMPLYNDPLTKVRKKAKKRLIKLFESIRVLAYENGGQTSRIVASRKASNKNKKYIHDVKSVVVVNKAKIKKEPTTCYFWNDDAPDWEHRIMRCLHGENDNRQLDNVGRDTGEAEELAIYATDV